MQTAVTSRLSSADEPDDFIEYAIENYDTEVSNRVKPSAVITDARAPARYPSEICAGRSNTIVSCSYQSGLAVRVPPDSHPLLGSIGFAAGALPRSDQHAEI